MKQKTVGKIIIDAAMTLLYVLLMIDFGGDTFFHEAAGILLGLLFVTHMLLNRTDLRALMTRVRGGHGSFETYGRLALALLLPCVMLSEMVTGILMARSVFSLGITIDWALTSLLHSIFAWTGAAILVGHIALHWSYLKAVTKACVKARKTAAVLMGFRRAGALLLAAAAIYAATYALYARAEKAGAVQTLSAETAVTESTSEESAVSEALPPDSETGSLAKTRDRKRNGKHGSTESSQTSAERSSSGSDGNDDSGSTENPTSSGDTPPTLDAFLQALTCTGCGRHCLLISPSCGKGIAQQQQATAQYEATYGEA